MWKSTFKNSIKALYEAYGQAFENYDSFKATFDAVTNVKYHCLLYDADKDPDNAYFDYIAPDKKINFKLKFNTDKKTK